MEVILLERIEKLGAIGDVVKVKNGYARNFLLPNGKALRANDSNRKVFEANRERIETQNAERRSVAETDSKGLEGVSIQLIRQASNTGQLYGSVSARDLADALEAQGHKVAKNQIVLDKPIKAIGVQDVKIALHPEVSVTVRVNVARSPEEAELQAQGVDVMAQMFERDAAGFTEEREPRTKRQTPKPEPRVQPEQDKAVRSKERAALLFGWSKAVMPDLIRHP
ncbi:MAG: 50S ribosomal protein L9 [Alphaproteobacteria bacterium]|nr:MAG: 50S ribosomal protein L9 [Alphaproteobacteria bacterium]